MILLNQSVNTSDFANFYTIEEVKRMLCNSLHKNINELTLFDQLHMWNYWENINSKIYFFQVMLHFINIKNHTYEIEKDIREEYYYENLTNKKKAYGINKGEIKKQLIQNIVNSDNITYSELLNFINKQKNENITDNEKYSIEKYVYKKKFNLNDNEITCDIMKKIYGKKYVINNYNKLINNIQTDDEIDNIECIENENVSESDSEKIDFIDEVQNKKLKWIHKIINTLGFEINDKEIIKINVQKDNFNKNKEMLIEEIDDEFKLLFKMKKSNKKYFKELLESKGKYKHDNNKFLAFINSLLKSYGVEIKTTRKSVRHKKQVKSFHTYMLDKCDITKIYLKNINM